MYKVKYYVSNQALLMLHHSIINSQVKYKIFAWGRAASCHLQPLLFVLNCAMCFLNTYEPATFQVTSIFQRQELLKLIFTLLKWANSCINEINLSYRLHLTISTLKMFIRIMQDKQKLGNFLDNSTFRHMSENADVQKNRNLVRTFSEIKNTNVFDAFNSGIKKCATRVLELLLVFLYCWSAFMLNCSNLNI